MYVLWRHPSWANWFLYPTLVHVTSDVFAHYKAKGAPVVEQAHEQTLKAAMHINGMTADDLVPYK